MTRHLLLLSILATQSMAMDGVRAASVDEEPDVFVQIAKQKNAVVPGLAPNPAPKLPDVVLPWSATQEPAIEPMDKIDTQEELEAELQKMRERYAPFMLDHAPAMPAIRRQWPIESFDWRLATGADREDIQYPIEGKGEWAEVDIPHYGGPVNKAMSFYRTQLVLTDEQLAQDRLVLHFDGADYIANVHLNGVQVGWHEGLFDAFEFDIKAHARAGANTLLIQLLNEPIMMGDNFQKHWKNGGRKFGKKFAACGGPGWDNPDMGWVMCPPGFGIWQNMYIETRSAVSIADVFVQPRPHQAEAEIWVELEGEAGAGTELRYSIYGQNFRAVLHEDKVASAQVERTEDQKSVWRFVVPIPAEGLRWWSHETPWLYQVQVQLASEGRVLDQRKAQFGMRTFVQSAASTPKGRFYLNGEEIRLRGANMMGNLMQCVMREDFDQLRDDILLAKIANMNFWRMTQQPCQPEVYDYFDKLGMLAQTDMPTFVGIWRSQRGEAVRQLEEMVRLVRGHPCNAVITYLNEPSFANQGGRKPMMSKGEHVELFKEFDVRACELNPQQVTKWIDGDYANINPGFSDHHDYSGWYGNRGGFLNLVKGNWHATRRGWMHGCGEYGAEGLDSIPTMKALYPEKWIKEGEDGSWHPRQIFRCQTATVGIRWIGKHKTMAEWVKASQAHQAWAVRLQTEAYRRDPKMNSSALHLLIDAWPAGWLKSVVSNDRTAKPAYFEFRDALTPLAANLKCVQTGIKSGETLPVEAWVCNDTQNAPDGVQLAYQLELAGKVIQTGRQAARIVACEPAFQGHIHVTAPPIGRPQPLIVRLALLDASGDLLHETSVDLDLSPAAE